MASETVGRARSASLPQALDIFVRVGAHGRTLPRFPLRSSFGETQPIHKLPQGFRVDHLRDPGFDDATRKLPGFSLGFGIVRYYDLLRGRRLIVDREKID